MGAKREPEKSGGKLGLGRLRIGGNGREIDKRTVNKWPRRQGQRIAEENVHRSSTIQSNIQYK